MRAEGKTSDITIPTAGWIRSHHAEAQLRDQGIAAVAYTVSYSEGGLLVFMSLEGELSVYFVDNDNEGTRLGGLLARQAWAAAVASDESFARA